ncbi:MAG: lipoyl synthase [Candidatus Micrarchaeota archaeon]|nr:lipoyl synthase [Candidatus Micrarchaeota archaeon]
MAKPPWLKIGLPTGKYNCTKEILDKLGVTTVCREAKCPNVNECWGNGTATIMILGDVCTRGCKFCNTKTAAEGRKVDGTEPERVARAARLLGLRYIVITSVDRDDLEDFGALHFAKCISAVRKECPNIKIEILAPDFQGNLDFVDIVCNSSPDVFGHNVEVVERLQKAVRDPRASYKVSLDVLRHVATKYSHIVTKSALMVGMGESEEEVLSTLRDLRSAGVKAVAIGQYLQPTKMHYPVKEYVTPEQFRRYGDAAREMGFYYVASGPFVRSSYMAGRIFPENCNRV